MSAPAPGIVYLVGAGPGDPGLLTLRAAELLREAEVVVYDALVNPILLRTAPPSAEIIFAGKRSKAHAIPQDELNQLLVAKAREGKRVVRLKGGDPYVFGRGGEEAQELAAAGIPFEVVPGVSSIVAAPAYAGIPITHRSHCSSFTVFTGHEDPAKKESAMDLESIARAPGTKIILMGVERIRALTEGLIAHGLPPTTPVGMVRWGTTGRQQSIAATLGTIADLVERSGFSAPAVTVIGGVVSLRDTLNWFEKKRLFGQRIVVTRTRAQASQLAGHLQREGADVIEIPTIKTVPPEDKETLADAILGLNAYDWVVFTSPNGVTTFFDYFFHYRDDLRDIGGVKIAAVGPATGAKLKELHLHVDLMPEVYLTSHIARAFAKFETIENEKILLVRAEVANPELPEALTAMGAIVDDVACYKTVPETEDSEGAVARLMEDGAHWITFTSSSTVEHFHARVSLVELIKRFPEIRLASIGPETTNALKALGLNPAVEANPHTIDGLVQAIEQAVARVPSPTATKT